MSLSQPNADLYPPNLGNLNTNGAPNGEQQLDALLEKWGINPFEQQTTEPAPTLTCDGIYPIAVNRRYLNKHDGSDWTGFNDSFTNEQLKLAQLIAEVQAGHAFTSPHRHEHPIVDGKAVCFRHSANWIESQHAGADHDDLSIFDALEIPFVAKYAAFVYTTPSHTEQAPRCRSVFIFDQVVSDKNYYTRAMRAIVWHLAGAVDQACKDPARLFYGAQGCTVRQVRNVLPLAVVDQLIADYAAEEARLLAEAQRERADKATRRTARPITGNDDVIARFNHEHPITDLLTAHGYHLIHEGATTDKLSRPDKKESKGVVVWKDAADGDTCYIHSSNDRLFVGDGHALDAFDCFRMLDHGGDFDRAFEAAKREQGAWTEKGTPVHLAPIDDEPQTPAPPQPTTTSGTAAAAADDDQEPPSPLMRPLPDRMPGLGWVDRYADLMTRLTGSPREFNLLGGLMVAAAAIQRRAVLHMSFGDIYPNLFGAVIARSSVYHKSSSLGKARHILKRAQLDRLLMAELATSEGLLKQLAGQGSGLIVRDEIGTLFGSHNQKYLITLKPDLTALYDCYPYSRRLSNDAVDVPSPYLNILGATTPTRFFESVSYTDWQDGFLARWLFVTPDKEPDFDAMTGLYTAEHDAALGMLATTLVNLDRQQETTFILAGDAHGIWDRWQRQAAREAYYYGNDIESAIVTRYAAYALKFSMILSAVNSSWGTVTEETMATAITLADMFKSNIGRLLAERSNYGVSGAKLQKVFAVVKRKDTGEGVTKKTIMQYVRGVRADDATACIEKLLEYGALVDKGTSSRSPHYVAIGEELPIRAWK